MGNRQLEDSWDEYRYFLAVARTGTISAAAAQLATEHTTVSRHVRMLERQLGKTLFHRSNIGYDLTDAGRRLLATAELIESAVMTAKLAAADEQQISGTVRVAAPDGFGTSFLAPRIGALIAEYPQLDIELFAIPRLFSLTKREADIVISLSPSDQTRLITRRLIDYKLYLYGSKTYLENAPPITDPEGVRSHRIVGYVEELAFSPQVNYLMELWPQAEARLRSTSVVVQTAAVQGGAGLGVLPAFIASQFPQLVPVLPEQISITRGFHMHLHEDNRDAAHVRATASFIVAEIEKNSGLFRNARRRPAGLAP